VDTAEIPATDFSLIHECFDSPIYKRLLEIRAATRHKIMGFMEIIFPSTLIDRGFCFLPNPWPMAEQIRLPCLRSLLDAHNSVEKFAGSILLDHGWIEKGKVTDWLPRLYEWLAPLKDRTIAQLRHPLCESVPLPPWVHSIPQANYPTYLAQTATYETFIMTHPGSYEHSIIDMAARGIRVLVPFGDGRPFCNPSIIEDLGLETFSTGEELLSLLSVPVPHVPVSPDRFNDMPQVVAQIDAYCQGAMQ
jgi:hypothetical protein